MGKLKFMILTEKNVAIIKDALRAYVALRTEEYQKNPDLRKAQIMDDINETLDLFINPKKPKSEIQKKVERISK
jgi:hypothetical protein